MPNWSINNLQVSGDKVDIELFKKKAKGEDTELSLNSLHPVPAELMGTVSPSSPRKKMLIGKYGADDWYDWRIRNWGTAWDVQAVMEDEDEKYLQYSFDSAWSPPVEWLEKVARDYPQLSFRLEYEEDGMDFMGVATAKEGKVSNRSFGN